MDEKTEELRDIFLDVAEDETVTESQAERRGTLGGDGPPVEERLRDVVERMRERFDFETDLLTETYAAIVRRFYDGAADEQIAVELDLLAETVRSARTDLHLLRDADAADVDLAAIRERVADGADPVTAAATLGYDEPTAERAAAVLRAQDASRRVSQRYRTEFEEILTDADVTVRLTAGVQEDGLDDVTEDMETDVQF
jgi:hypothetical protein